MSFNIIIIMTSYSGLLKIFSVYKPKKPSLMMTHSAIGTKAKPVNKELILFQHEGNIQLIARNM